MNILIVGNGFDLSHYLPTKYDHFMDVMGAIEEKKLGQPISNVFKNPVDDFPTLLMKVIEIKNALNENNYEMNFNELFSKCREKWFIEKTQSIYCTDSINLNFEKIIEIQYQLKKNVWYQYFKSHVKDIKTWIDFEQKIEEVLRAFSKMLSSIERNEIDFEDLEFSFHELIDKNSVKILNYFKIFKEIGGLVKINQKYVSTPIQLYLNSNFFYGKTLTNGFSPSVFLNFISSQLDSFIEIFNLYLELVVSRLIPISALSIESDDWIYPDKIYSFNYTNTYQRIHDSVSVKVEYLHGSHGEEQNIVLGVSDLEDDYLKKIKAYGFTKYHQKLFKDTDYLFLDNYKHKIKQHNLKVAYFEKDSDGDDPTIKRFTRQQLIEKESKLNLNISIWGHSLDVSDQDYIKDLFSLNDDMDRNVRVTVYHFNKMAKFDLLNNLLAILGKDKVEHWMKNKCLVFKLNPEIKPV